MSESPGSREADVAAYIPLPGGLSDPRATAGGIFDRIADLYDRARPGYPPAAVADLKQLCGISRASKVLEIGCGTGQLTRDLAPGGAQILCVEPGPDLAHRAQSNLAAFANVEVVTSTFEALQDAPGGYDVIVSATAFHWIDPALAFAKAAHLLKAGGYLALVTNTHTAGGSHTQEPFAAAVRELHRRLAPEIGDWTFPTALEIERLANAGGDIAALWARVERKLSEPPHVSDLFAAPEVRICPWLATYGTDGYLDMLASQSSYALMDPGRRRDLLDGIVRLIDDHLSGTITKQYVTVLAIARRKP